MIDSSELTPQGDGHMLRWTVRNHTSGTLAMIAVELSLLDSTGEIVLRRVFLPDQTGAPEALTAGQPWLGELYFKVQAERQFSTYRLLGFYP